MTDTPPTRRAPRVTLREVAERAGVSRSAVSFVMNGRTDQRLSDDVFERVRRAADELGYRPNITAQTLRTGRSGTVALVSDFVSSTSFANSMVRGAMQELREHDTLLFTVDTQGDADLEEQLLQSLLGRDIDGVIYASMFTRTIALPRSLEGVPTVLLNCVTADASIDAVVPDEIAAGRDAARMLLDHGHRDGIWFVGALPAGSTGGAAWPEWDPIALAERRAGIDSVLAAAGTSLAGVATIDDDWDVANGRRAVARLLAESRSAPTALVCANDALAVGAYQALHHAGLRVPTDVSVIGFDGSPYARAVDPELTSIALPHIELGRRAAAMLAVLGDAPRLERVPMPIRTGGSVAAPPSR
ncbi:MULTISPECIES: LacI family DNA-binding transcriptional regulator [Microbacterium]|uniref:LacI family DNA-binding transcriptional regulator n=1 Tax=Microbacterium TaxID=33882 RepID=UPI000E72346B|nr:MULTISPECIES: LacI family DNA-binding transcriptional regulator [Microbacterium]MDF2560500.1 LacI family transcriptional regulator [Microbacterium sp.]RKE63588.1 LacI family transcriptional regulator [Microbacterium sp. AG238]WJM16783.1 LacI family DNA-binding transcriptional regulator [Microbacterium arborescens]